MRIAALDLGSNSFHLLVVEARSVGAFDVLGTEKEMLRLGDEVARHGIVRPEAVERAPATLRRFRATAESLGAEEIVAKATSALREAGNGTEVVDRLEAETGISIDVIAGVEEARLIFAAIRASVVIDPGPAVCLDLGGGSLEVMVGDNRALHHAASVKLGVARLAAELVSSDPPAAEELRAVSERARMLLAPIAEHTAHLAPAFAVGTSGTLNDIVRMAEALRSGSVPQRINQLSVSREMIEDVHRQVIAMPSKKRESIRGLETKRADIIPVGTTVLLEAMDIFGVDSLVAGEWALREGIVLDAIGHHDAAELMGDAAGIRRSSALGLAHRCGVDEAHAAQVASLATLLFDRTVELHGLGHEDRELLEHAALLHDIGEHVAVEGHHKHSAYLIENGKLRGFTPEEIDVLSSLARFHRRSEPKTSYEPWGRLPTERRQVALQLLALLRLADGLDRGHASDVRDLDVRIDDGTVLMTVLSDADTDVDLWGARRKRELFEKVFAKRVELVAAEVFTS